MPPVQDSAVASVSPRSRQRPRTISAIERSSSPKRYWPSVARSESATRAPRSCAPGSTNRSTWISNSRAQIVTSTPSPSPPAAASASATADSGVPKKRSTRCSRAGARASTRRTASVSSARGHSRWSSRGGPGRTTTTVGTEIEHEARCRSGEPERLRALRPRRLLAHARREVQRTAARAGPRSCARPSRSAPRAPRRAPAPSRRHARRARPSGRRASGRGRPRRGRDPRRIPPGTRARGPRRDPRRSRSTPARAPGARPRRRETVRCGPPARP